MKCVNCVSAVRMDVRGLWRSCGDVSGDDCGDFVGTLGGDLGCAGGGVGP